MICHNPPSHWRFADALKPFSSSILGSFHNEERRMSNIPAHHTCAPAAHWSPRREAALNWLALGLLLAAWNATSRDAGANMVRRPEMLRGYEYVSPRAAMRAAR
jgi:hypothetical protein